MMSLPWRTPYTTTAEPGNQSLGVGSHRVIAETGTGAPGLWAFDGPCTSLSQYYITIYNNIIYIYNHIYNFIIYIYVYIYIPHILLLYHIVSAWAVTSKTCVSLQGGQRGFLEIAKLCRFAAEGSWKWCRRRIKRMESYHVWSKILMSWFGFATATL